MQPEFVEAKKIPSLESEVCFTIQESFYYGPDHFSDISDYEKLVEKLIPPNIQVVIPSMVRTSEALGHEQELAAYYQQVICMARFHKCQFNSIRQYFWMRLWLWNSDHDVHISFPWYDSFAEIDQFLSALIEVGSGSVFHDTDQGWEVQAHAIDDNVYLLQCDPDSEETLVAICVPRDELVAQVTVLRERAKFLVSKLSSILGADVWTSYVETEPDFKVAGE